MQSESTQPPESWLAFELNILRRLEFKSVAIPITGNPVLGRYLKNWDTRVFANDLLRSSYLEAVSVIENNDFQLSDTETELILEDAYVPQFELKNPSLRTWFGETDAWWFDNVRSNIERLDSEMSKAVAISIVFEVGDYALSFDDETRRLRQPFSKVFRKFRGIHAEPVDNHTQNTCQNKNANEFTAENYTDLLFLRLPRPRNVSLKRYLGRDAWREEWVRGRDDIWNELENKMDGRLGARVETKSQYLGLLEDLFKTASHIPKWAIVLSENTFVSTQDIVESLAKVKRVDTIYTKDFTELMGTKAVIITA
ncbi:MAG: hypothetical protein OEM82_05595 [Acidobacteriota bacterium]|nr:hypothetical protein [Acidobacteriota bacterium]